MNKVLFLFVFLVGCATIKPYNGFDADSDLKLGLYEPVAKYYQDRIDKKEGSSVLNHLNLAMVYQKAGEYKKSNTILKDVSRYIDLTNEYVSLTEEAKALMVSDDEKRYTLSEYEILFLFYSMSVNFLMQGDYDNAIVSARKMNQRINYISSLGKELDSLTKSMLYYSALLYETEGSLDSAYIDYKRSSESDQVNPYLKFNLWKASYLTQRDTSKISVPKWYKDFVKSGKEKQMTEVIVLFNNGWGPFKEQNKYNAEIPQYVGGYSETSHLEIKVNGVDKGRSVIFFDVNEVAIKTLEKKFDEYKKRSVARFVAMEALALPLDVATGGATSVFVRGGLHSIAEADLRSWSLMPKNIQMARLNLSPGRNKIQIVLKGQNDIIEKEIYVKPSRGKKQFIFIDSK